MKRWMQRCAACLVAILCAVFVPGRALALETPAEARSGVVRVIVEMQTDLYSLETGEPVGTLQGYSSGSAFGVGAAGEETDIFVTNRHVVTLSEGEERGTTEMDGTPVYFERSSPATMSCWTISPTTPSPSSWTPAVPCPSG